MVSGVPVSSILVCASRLFGVFGAWKADQCCCLGGCSCGFLLLLAFLLLVVKARSPVRSVRSLLVAMPFAPFVASSRS